MIGPGHRYTIVLKIINALWPKGVILKRLTFVEHHDHGEFTLKIRVAYAPELTLSKEYSTTILWEDDDTCEVEVKG